MKQDQKRTTKIVVGAEPQKRKPRITNDDALYMVLPTNNIYFITKYTNG